MTPSAYPIMAFAATPGSTVTDTIQEVLNRPEVRLKLEEKAMYWGANEVWVIFNDTCVLLRCNMTLEEAVAEFWRKR